MSASGMRVLCEGKPPVKQGGLLTLRLRFADGSLQIQSQVRWCRRKGIRKHEIGLMFVQMRPGMAQVLESVAKFGAASFARGMGEPGDDAGGAKKQGSHASPTVVAELPNYFRILEVEPDASEGEIKAAYRRLAVIWHPDVNSDPEAMERFEQINEAYHVLADRDRRASYRRMAG